MKHRNGFRGAAAAFGVGAVMTLGGCSNPYPKQDVADACVRNGITQSYLTQYLDNVERGFADPNIPVVIRNANGQDIEISSEKLAECQAVINGAKDYFDLNIPKSIIGGLAFTVGIITFGIVPCVAKGKDSPHR